MDLGGASWLMDFPPNLDRIVLSNGAQLVIPENVSATEILSDTKSTVFILPSSNLLLGREMRTNTYVYPLASVEFATGADVMVQMWCYVRGELITNVTTHLTVSGNLTLTQQNLAAASLTVADKAKMTVVHDVFTAEIAKIKVIGNFEARGLTDFVGITDFIVEAPGVMKFDPITSDLYLGRRISLNGNVFIGKSVSFRHPCETFVLAGGVLQWPSPANITIECSQVYINGKFHPGTVNFADGILSLQIGPLGDFVCEMDGPVLTNVLDVSGKWYITNLVEFKSLNRSDSRIEKFVVSSPNGNLRLNTNNLPLLVNGTSVSKF